MSDQAEDPQQQDEQEQDEQEQETTAEAQDEGGGQSSVLGTAAKAAAAGAAVGAAAGAAKGMVDSKGRGSDESGQEDPGERESEGGETA